MNPPRILLAVVCAVSLAACGNGAATGSGVDTNAKGGPGTLFASSAPPKKTAQPAPSKPAPKPPQAAPKPPPRQQPKPPPPRQPQVPTFRITLNGDKSGKPLVDPPQAAVYSGTKVTWVNADSKPHGVQAQNGAFNSGPIAPGASYTWVAGAAGMYAYQDSSRPYVNAQLQVTGR